MKPEELQKLTGKTVESASEYEVLFTDGTKLRWAMEGDNGADGGWYTFLRVYVNNKRVANL